MNEMNDERRQIQELYRGSLKERDHLKDIGVDGIILNWILKKQDWRLWTGLTGLTTGCCEHRKQPRGSIRCREFLD